MALRGDGPNPSGLCQCGCGESTPPAKRSDSRRGLIAGKPVRFIRNHHRRTGPSPITSYVVDEATGCWLWMLRLDRSGYGKVTRCGRSYYAHTALYEERYGPVPKGLELDHLCRNVRCCNPAHMEAVTPTENKRRSRATKLTEGDVRTIRASSESHAVLATQFGVTPHNIYHIRTFRSWRDVAVAA